MFSHLSKFRHGFCPALKSLGWISGIVLAGSSSSEFDSDPPFALLFVKSVFLNRGIVVKWYMKQGADEVFL